MSADYELTWDKDGFFRNTRSQNQDKSSKMQEPAAVRYRSESPRREPHVSEFTSNNTRRKRFKVRIQLDDDEELGFLFFFSILFSYSYWLICWSDVLLRFIVYVLS